MRLTNLWSLFTRRVPKHGRGKTRNRFTRRFVPELRRLESRDVPNGYLAIGAGPGFLPEVAIRIDIHDAFGGSPPNNAGQPALPRSDGKTETTSQVLMAYAPTFRGGVNVATGNFDGDATTPDQLVTAPKAGGGPHVIIWNTQESTDGTIVVTGIRAQFYAFDFRFTGGVNVTTGDLDGDGKAELIVGAGPGGGPHVKVFTTNAAGNFVLATEFFAYDASFRGGVSLGSNQGYSSLVQVRQVLSAQLPANFSVTPYAPGETVPGSLLGVPLVGFDSPVPPGGLDFGTGQVVPTGNAGTLDSMFRPLPYLTVGAGILQYLSGNLINNYGQMAYRPNIFVPPFVTNTANAGNLVFATWADATATSNYPTDGSNPPTGSPVGPYVQVGVTGTGTPVITRLTEGPGALNVRNQLVTGAGPGGGPHVRVWAFSGLGTGLQAGMAKEFYAFAPSFRGGVNVAIGDVISNPSPAGATTVEPGRFDWFAAGAPPVPFLIETTGNSGTNATPRWPFDPELFRRYSAEILVTMASGGSQARIFADNNPALPDPNNPLSGSAPQSRMSVADVNLVPTFIDTIFGPDPTNPLGGFNNLTSTTNFNHAIDPQFTGGLVPAVSAFTFNGTIRNQVVGTNALGLPDSGFVVNPVLGQSVFGVGTGAATPNRGSKIRIFNQMSELTQLSPSYSPIDDFSGFNSYSGVGVTLSFGFGALPNPGVDIVALPTLAPGSVSNPILI